MTVTEQIAKHYREVHFGGNWTTTNLRDTIADVTWQEATTQVGSFNTIAVLLFHVNYFVGAQLMVLEGGELNANDKYSFDLPPITSQQEWEALKERVWEEAERAAGLIEKLPESCLGENFVDPKYGTWFRNLVGLIEHTHYHLGQIALLRKLVREEVGEVDRAG